ncbi:MAG: hypothetical protein ACK56F_27950, partial [bacterium]
NFAFDSVDEIPEHFVNGGFAFLPGFFLLLVHLVYLAHVLVHGFQVFVVRVFTFYCFVFYHLVQFR